MNENNLPGTFTPCFDLFSECYPKHIDRIFGKVYRFAQNKEKACTASIDRIAKELNLSYSTIIRTLDYLIKVGFIIDKTPNLRNHPHTYLINYDLLDYHLAEFEKYNRNSKAIIIVGSSDLLTNSAIADLPSDNLESTDGMSNLPSAMSNLPSAMSNLPTASSELPSDSFNLTDEDKDNLIDNLRDSQGFSLENPETFSEDSFNNEWYKNSDDYQSIINNPIPAYEAKTNNIYDVITAADTADLSANDEKIILEAIEAEARKTFEAIGFIEDIPTPIKKEESIIDAVEESYAELLKRNLSPTPIVKIEYETKYPENPEEFITLARIKIPQSKEPNKALCRLFIELFGKEKEPKIYSIIGKLIKQFDTKVILEAIIKIYNNDDEFYPDKLLPYLLTICKDLNKRWNEEREIETRFDIDLGQKIKEMING